MTDETRALASAVTVDTWNQLTEFVAANEGVVTVSMQLLREVAGAGRLGSTVRAEILEKLNAFGVGVIRDELPNTQQATVLLYTIDSRCGRVIQAILNVLSGHNGEVLEDAAQTLSDLNDVQDPNNLRVELYDAVKMLDDTAQKAREILA